MVKPTAKVKAIDNTDTPMGVGDYLLASKNCEILALERLLGMGQLLANISHLTHALQLERGASNMYLGSGGKRCAETREQQVKSARSAEQCFRECLKTAIDSQNYRLSCDSRLLSRIAYAIHGLDELESVRESIRTLKTEPEVIIDGYSELIQGLLAIVYETADSAADPEISRILVAMFHLMQGKEMAGQERAVGSAGFAQGRFDENFSQRLRRLIDSQDRCFQIFINFSDQGALEHWNQLTNSSYSGKLERLRRIAFTSAAEGVADPELSDVWFMLTSERIDALKHIEQYLEQSLSNLCRQKIAEAKQEMDCQKLHIDALAHHSKTPAFAVFFSTAADKNIDISPETFNTGCAGPQLGRSLFDLVHSQATRLQAMTEELDAAREALSERKTIEKAKGLIMNSRHVSEDEAYRFMRQVAMAQNRRLVEIARDTLAMADLFTLGGGA